MGLFGDLLGLIVSGGAAAAGAGINAHEKKKRWNEYQHDQQEKLQAKLDYAKSIREAEDAETQAFRVQLERWIGGRLEEDQRKKRYYNLLLEFDLALQILQDLQRHFEDAHPPGAVVRILEPKFVSYYSNQAQQVLCDYEPLYHEEVLPYSENAYRAAVKDAFWRRSLTTYRGPKLVGAQEYVVTYFVDPGTYAVGEARKQIIREGFLPSNCRNRLWINWSPYVRYTGPIWNDEFHTAVDIMYGFALNWLTPTSYPEPEKHREAVVHDQRGYEQQHPEYFKMEESHE